MIARYFSSLGLAAAAACIMAPGAGAQSLEFDVHDTVLTTKPSWTADFKTDVINTSKQDLKFVVSRLEENYPGPDWYSFICTDICYGPETSNPPSVIVKPGMKQECKVSIMTGASPGTGKVTIRLAQEGALSGTVLELSAMVGSAAGVSPERSASSLRPAYPNPTASVLAVPMATEYRSPASASLKVYDATGRMMEDYSSEARVSASNGQGLVMVNVSSLPAGSYIYQLAVDGRTETASFVVAR